MRSLKQGNTNRSIVIILSGHMLLLKVVAFATMCMCTWKEHDHDIGVRNLPDPS